jgi:hypothetical protein
LIFHCINQTVCKTGGTIKPGTYKSKNGDVAFFSVGEFFSGAVINIDDTVGDLTVTIGPGKWRYSPGSFFRVDDLS